MTQRVLAGFAAILLSALAATADDVPAPDVQLSVDGANVPGVLGWRIEFVRDALLRTDSRRLGLAYSPEQRKLQLTVTQKGLRSLQDWLNSATDTGTPAARTVVLTAVNAKDQVLVRWEVSGAVPTSVSQAAAGQFSEVTATLEFLFDRMRLIEASAE